MTIMYKQKNKITSLFGDPVTNLFCYLGINNVKTSDSFSITYHEGILIGKVSRKSGKIETAVKYVEGDSFKKMLTFEPEKLTKIDRNAIIKNLHDNGKKQADIAKIFDISPAIISKIVSLKSV